ncbi:hypothetical protein K491DRAFT_317013 [Lophiostoma macrostomum CBS 122681]|uniref:Uncharacterized protein n=1 Tax=Lophiostoma macrostomum CBS 122681 TaxID=1314788 RepID=A0A6A6SIA1_9PLEO|nr:hypothetical protein K491DRAFT_317013 [Lophiostoma macrostomum CBS 122681]
MHPNVGSAVQSEQADAKPRPGAGASSPHDSLRHNLRAVPNLHLLAISHPNTFSMPSGASSEPLVIQPASSRGLDSHASLASSPRSPPSPHSPLTCAGSSTPQQKPSASDQDVVESLVREFKTLSCGRPSSICDSNGTGFTVELSVSQWEALEQSLEDDYDLHRWFHLGLKTSWILQSDTHGTLTGRDRTPLHDHFAERFRRSIEHEFQRLIAEAEVSDDPQTKKLITKIVRSLGIRTLMNDGGVKAADASFTFDCGSIPFVTIEVDYSHKVIPSKRASFFIASDSQAVIIFDIPYRGRTQQVADAAASSSAVQLETATPALTYWIYRRSVTQSELDEHEWLVDPRCDVNGRMCLSMTPDGEFDTHSGSIELKLSDFVPQEENDALTGLKSDSTSGDDNNIETDKNIFISHDQLKVILELAYEAQTAEDIKSHDWENPPNPTQPLKRKYTFRPPPEPEPEPEPPLSDPESEVTTTPTATSTRQDRLDGRNAKRRALGDV